MDKISLKSHLLDHICAFHDCSQLGFITVESILLQVSVYRMHMTLAKKNGHVSGNVKPSLVLWSFLALLGARSCLPSPPGITRDVYPVLPSSILCPPQYQFEDASSRRKASACQDRFAADRPSVQCDGAGY